MTGKSFLNYRFVPFFFTNYMLHKINFKIVLNVKAPLHVWTFFSVFVKKNCDWKFRAHKSLPHVANILWASPSWLLQPSRIDTNGTYLRTHLNQERTNYSCNHLERIPSKYQVPCSSCAPWSCCWQIAYKFVLWFMACDWWVVNSVISMSFIIVYNQRYLRHI